MNNWEKWFGSPEAVDRTFKEACKECSNACRQANIPCPCAGCGAFHITGFVVGRDRLSWLTEECEEAKHG